ncbi:MAG: hypothetical protein AAFY26_00435 [Cyanobacteria bacterium J06638_22]
MTTNLLDILAFIIVFGLLATLVGTLATGVLRIAGFSVLVAIALIISGPYLQTGTVPWRPRTVPTTTAPAQTQTTTTTTTSPVRSVPANVGSGTSFSTTGTVENESTVSETTGGGSVNQTRRGVRAMW